MTLPIMIQITMTKTVKKWNNDLCLFLIPNSFLYVSRTRNKRSYSLNQNGSMTSLCNLSKTIWKINENYRNFGPSKFHNSWTSGWILIYIIRFFIKLAFCWILHFLNFENLPINKKVILIVVFWNILKSFCHAVTDNFHEPRIIPE